MPTTPSSCPKCACRFMEGPLPSPDGVVSSVAYQCAQCGELVNMPFSPPMTPRQLQARADWVGEFFGLESATPWSAASVLRQGQLDIEAKLDRVLAYVGPSPPDVEPNVDTNHVWDIMNTPNCQRCGLSVLWLARFGGTECRGDKEQALHADTCSARATLDPARCDCGRG